MYKLLVKLFLLLITFYNVIFCDSKLSGYILNQNNIPVSYANINVVGMSLGTTSNQDGFFILSVPLYDSIKVEISYIGYKTKTFFIYARESEIKLENIILQQHFISFSPLEVIGQRDLIDLEKIEPSFKFIKADEIPLIPSIGGKDVFRTFQSMEGVNTTSEYSNQLYIRGGTPDQNLILMNGAPLYQPFHLFGLASAINESAVDYIKYYSGGFSAEYGDYMSSVMDIVTKAGTNKIGGDIDINPLKVNLSLGGPLTPKLRWCVTGQKSYFNQFEDILDLNLPYKFYDIEGKLSYLPTNNTLITLNLFQSEDKYFDYETIEKYNTRHTNSQSADSNRYFKVYDCDVNWKNQLASLRFVKNLSSNSNFGGTAYFSSLKQNIDFLNCYIPDTTSSAITIEFVDEENKIENKKTTRTKAKTAFYDLGANLKYSSELNENVYVVAGVGINQKLMDYNWEISDFNLIDTYINFFMDYPPDTMDNNKKMTIASTFIETRIRWLEQWTLRLGLRPTWYSEYSEISLDPRINISYAMFPWLSLKTSYGLFSQSLSSSQEYGFYSMANIYLISPKVPTCRHLFLGADLTLPNHLNITLNVFHKHYRKLLFIRSTSELACGKADAYGVDLISDWQIKSWLYTKLIYCYSVAEKLVDGERFYPNYDQRHRLVARCSMKLKRNYNINVVWNFSTGRPANLANTVAYTGDTGSYPSFIMDMPKNSFWYPAYHRLDIGLKKSWKIKSTNLSISIDVINVYNRENVVYYKDLEILYQYGFDENGNDIIEMMDITVEQQNGFPLIPMIGMQYEF